LSSTIRGPERRQVHDETRNSRQARAVVGAGLIRAERRRSEAQRERTEEIQRPGDAEQVGTRLTGTRAAA